MDEFQWIPDEVKKKRNFCCWKYEERTPGGGKVTKPPIDVHTGRYASVDGPDTWATLEEAMQYYEKNKEGRIEGIGIVLSKELELVGIDLDHCILDGRLTPEARDIVDTMKSYTEVTPSGEGLRVFVKGKLPGFGNRKSNVEMYGNGRYLTLTDRHYAGTPLTVESRQEELEEMWKKYVHIETLGKSANHRQGALPAASQPATGAPTGSTVNADIRRRTGEEELTDSEILSKAMRAKNGETFRRLWNGDIGEASDDWSKADLMVCGNLAFWTAKDAARIDSLFRQSGLYRAKWDEKRGELTYGERTIRKAIEVTGNVYDPVSRQTRQKPDLHVVPGGQRGQGQAAAALASAHPQEQPVSVSRISPAFSMTDMGNAERMALMHCHRIRYCVPEKKFYVFLGTHWEHDRTQEIVRCAFETVGSIYAEASKAIGDDPKESKALARHAMASSSEPKIRHMIKLLEAQPGIPVLPEQLDPDPWVLNAQNGTIALKTMELSQHDPRAMITKTAKVVYDPAAKCPAWDAFLFKAMAGNKEMVRFLQQAVGYSLTGDTREQVVFFLWGEGANGKSTFIGRITTLLGGYAKTTRPETFMVKSGDGANNDIAELKGARFVASTELEEGRRAAEVVIKQVSGGDEVKARHLFQEFFAFKPQLKLWLCGNHKPRITGTDHAIWRRIRLVPWSVTIPDAEQDKELAEKLERELPGILNWALAGCKDWQQNGLITPDEVMISTAAYREEQNVLKSFIDGCVVFEKDATVSVSELYEAYSRFYDENEGNQRFKLGKIRFNEKLDEGSWPVDRYEEKSRNKTQMWIGLRLRRVNE